MLKNIKKALMLGHVVLTDHTKERMMKRGYSKRDLVSCLMNGKIIETQHHQGGLRVVIAGLDYYDNPIACVMQQHDTIYHMITVMPPYDRNRFDDVI